MSNKEQGSMVLFVALVVFGLAFLMQALSGGGSSSSSTPAPSTSRNNSFERRYVEQRFKQEGYSSQDAATAADAILKFQRAQEARKR